MSKLIPLSPSEHRSKCIDPGQAIKAFRTAQVVRLRVPEVGNAACCFPVFFTKDPQQGHWDISALTGLEPESNLYVGSTGWQGLYSPLAVRTYPIRLMKQDINQELHLAVNPEAIVDAGERLYDDHGRQTPYLNAVEKALHEDLEGASATQAFCRQLQTLQLIKPINIQLQYQDGASRTLEGLYTLDQDKLATLDDNVQLELQKRGYLMVMHSMLISLFQLNRLIQRHNEQDNRQPVKKISLQRR